VAVIGGDGRLQLSNPEFGAMWNIPAELLGTSPHINEIVDWMQPLLAPVEDWNEERQRIVAMLTDRESGKGRLERPDGMVLDFATMPLPDGAVQLSYLDVTASINMERARRERNEALETADRLKSEFIANVSYELRTPLNTIIGFTQILTGQYFGELNTRQREYGRGILESSNRLLLLINDILDLATIEAGHMTLELDFIDVHGLLTNALGLVRERARHKKLKLECDCPHDIGRIVADERRLKQILFNILSNAVKFTPDNGNIILSARRLEDELVLTTSDSGIGIAEEDHARVFGKFERGDNPEARRSGVGLEIESEPTVGTKVVCFLPARQSESAAI
jgi:signal transduction histidine kinase